MRSGASGASDCSRTNFRLCLPPPSTSLPSSSAHIHQWQLSGETTPAPHTVSHGTEVGAYGLLGTPASATSAAHVTETIRGHAAHFFPLAPYRSRSHSPASGGEVLRGVQPPTVFPVNSVCAVPVRSDHPCRLPCSAASFCSSSVFCSNSRDTSVPVGSFSPLAPVHLVCPFNFLSSKRSYRAAAAYVSNGPHNAFRISFEALSVSLQSGSSNMRSAFDHASIIDTYLATEVLCGWVAGPSTAVCRFNQPFWGGSKKQPAKKMVLDSGSRVSRWQQCK